MSERGVGRPTVEAAQLKRLEHYPQDRIPFLRNSMAVTEDCAAFKKYRWGEITLDDLRRSVARTNCLPIEAVTDLRLTTELEITGWMNYSKKSEDTSMKPARRGRPRLNA